MNPLNNNTHDFETLLEQAEALVKNESDCIANLANLSALLFQFYEDVNWVGFYRYVNQELLLGPFQGNPACIRIPFGKGVCGKAVETKQTQCIPNVQEFPGHIACDQSTNSELVICIIKNAQVVGVLDLDSQKYNRFSQDDIQALQRLSSIIAKYCDFKTLLK